MHTVSRAFVRHIGHVVTLVMSAQPSHRHLCPHGTHAWDRSANIQMTHCSAVATVDVASDGRGNGADSAETAFATVTLAEGKTDNSEEQRKYVVEGVGSTCTQI